jgi:ubiquinone/menaquinone biosynthesis C-methylase UbiE
MGLISNVLNQCRKPSGWFGRFVLWDMNRYHANVTDWGLQHLAIEQHDTILDVGCGGGRTVHKLAGIATESKVYGLDFTQESVSVSRRTNTRWIQLGRVDIHHGLVSCLPFCEHLFDLVTAVETHFFWPDLVADLHEVLCVLKPGGKLIIIAKLPFCWVFSCCSPAALGRIPRRPELCLSLLLPILPDLASDGKRRA